MKDFPYTISLIIGFILGIAAVFIFHFYVMAKQEAAFNTGVNNANNEMTQSLLKIGEECQPLVITKESGTQITFKNTECDN